MINEGVWIDIGMKEMAATKIDGHVDVGVVSRLIDRGQGRKWSYRGVGSGIHLVIWGFFSV